MTKLADTPELQHIVAAPSHSLPLTWRLASLRLMMLAVADAGSVGAQAHAPWTGSEQDGGERGIAARADGVNKPVQPVLLRVWSLWSFCCRTVQIRTVKIAIRRPGFGAPNQMSMLAAYPQPLNYL